MKKILFLGAARFQTPPIEYARVAGYQVFTCDNRPSNYGHVFAHQSFCISTADKDQVGQLAEKLKVDGIVAFGSDVAALTKAAVGEALGLPGPSLRAVELLSRKHLFREFLQTTGIQKWDARSFSATQISEATLYGRALPLPILVKPTDANGSRGITIVREESKISAAISVAIAASAGGTVVIEAFFQKAGFQVCGDGYMEEGKLVFVAFGDGHYYDDFSHLAPFAETFPSLHSPAVLARLRIQLELILQKAGYRQGPFNLDCLIGSDEQIFTVEIGPRNGGNFISVGDSLPYGCRPGGCDR